MNEERKRPLKVFLCHASGDKPAVRAIYQRLVRDGVDAWLDKEKLLPGQDWQLEIPRAVRESDVVIVCLSNKSITKEGYVQKEIKFALDIANEKPEGTIFLIPARLEECDVPSQLGLWHWVDLFESDGYERLMRSLQLRADKLGLGIADTRYTDPEVEQRLDQLYTEGLAALWVEDWDKAQHRFQAILREKPDHLQAIAKLDEAKRQKYLNALYTQALIAQENENWHAAVETFEKLTSEVADYKDAALLLKNARKKRQLLDLYEEARKLHKARQWQAVLKVFAQIAAIEPNYQDPAGLLSSAQKEVAEIERLEKLNKLYSQGVREMDQGHWYEARDFLERVHKAQTGFLETERLLKKVDFEIAKIEELKQRNIQINTLYEQAHGLVRSRNWRAALDKIEEIRRLDHKFEDKEGIAETAKTALKLEEREIQRQNQLAAMYAEAVRFLKEGKYQEASDKWQEIKEIDPKYSDRQSVQRIARKKLGEVTSGRPAIPKNRGLWTLGTTFFVVIVGAIIWSVLKPDIEPNATSTPTLLPSTKIPVNTPMAAGIPAVKKVLRDFQFDATPSSDFAFLANPDHINVSDGVLHLIEPLVSGDPWADGQAALEANFFVQKGTGYLILFRKRTVDAQFLITFEREGFNTPGYRAFWVENAQQISVWNGKEPPIFRKDFNFQFQLDTWYYLLMRLYGDEAEIRLWKKDHPETVFTARTETQQAWSSNVLKFHVGVAEGTLEIDEIQVVEFSGKDSLPLGE